MTGQEESPTRRESAVTLIAAAFDVPASLLERVAPPDAVGVLAYVGLYDREAHIASYADTDYRAEHDPPDEWDLTYWDCGYSWCRPCTEWHRLPECPVDEEGYALTWDGQRWADQP